MWAQMKEGMRFILGHSILRPLLASVATLNFFNFVFAALFILYATRELHVRSGTLGDRPRRGRDRRPARGRRGRAPQPSFRDRAHLRLRDGALPGAATARPPGGRAQDGSSSPCSSPPSFSLGLAS